MPEHEKRFGCQTLALVPSTNPTPPSLNSVHLPPLASRLSSQLTPSHLGNTSTCNTTPAWANSHRAKHNTPAAGPSFFLPLSITHTHTPYTHTLLIKDIRSALKGIASNQTCLIWEKKMFSAVFLGSDNQKRIPTSKTSSMLVAPGVL